MSAFVKGCRTSAVAMWVGQARTAGVGQASVEETAGGLGALSRQSRSMGICGKHAVLGGYPVRLDHADPVGIASSGVI